jgi:hypothetical protein
MRPDRPSRRRLRVVPALAAAAAIALAAAGCSKTPSPPPAITVVDAFTTPGDQSLAVYFSLTNEGGSDRIVAAELAGADAGLAERVTLHATVERNGLAVMEPAERIDVAADSDTALSPGGGHLMLQGITAPVVLGDELELAVIFERSGTVETTVVVVPTEDALGRLQAGSVTP